MLEEFDYHNSQAASLIKLSDHRPTQVIAVTGGKGGIGKTNISVNLSLALAELREKVLLFDADLSLANVDVLLNFNVTHNLSHVLNQCIPIEDILIDGPKGIKVLPAASGINSFANLSKLEYAGIIRAFDQLNTNFDQLIIDTAAGISDDVIMFTQAASETMIVVCDEPTSITDAYALIKVLHKDHGQSHFHVVANMVNSHLDGRHLFYKLNKATERFLGLSLDFCGIVPFDILVRRAVQKQKAVIDAYPGSLAALAIRKIAKHVCKWPVRNNNHNNIKFFWEQMISMNEYAQGALI